MRKWKRVMGMLTIVCLCALVSITVIHSAQSDQTSDSGLSQGASRQTKYSLYIGLNDSETKMQVLPIDEAQALVNKICAKYAPGFTSYQGQGGWTDDGKLIEEASLIYVIFNAEEENIIAFMDEVLSTLHQSEILLEMDEVETLYYGS